MRLVVKKYLLLLTVPLMASVCVLAQTSHPPGQQPVSPATSPVAAPGSTPAPPAATIDTVALPSNVLPLYGPYDTIIVSAKVYDNDAVTGNHPAIYLGYRADDTCHAPSPGRVDAVAECGVCHLSLCAEGG
jgi:hypothetical protein